MMSSPTSKPRSALHAFMLFLCFSAPLLGQPSSKSVTFAVFEFHDPTVEDQERGQNTASGLTTDVVTDLNQKFGQRPLLKYWQFQTGQSAQFPYLRISICYVRGWNLCLSVVDPKKGVAETTHLEERLFLPGESTYLPSGYSGWKSVVLKALDRLVGEDRQASVLKILQSVPVTGTIKALNRERGTVPLPADSENDLFQRRFLVELLGPEKEGGKMYPCGTGKPMRLSAEVRMSPRLSTPPEVFPGFIAKRYTPFAVYLAGTCDQMPEISVMQ